MLLRLPLPLLCLTLLRASVDAQWLEAELQSASAAALAVEARAEGDAQRGAIVFFQQHMACSKCHSVGGSQPSALGPDMATLDKATADETLVESVLQPSKVIRKGFESVTAITRDGQSLAGLLVERSDAQLMIRELTRGGETTTLAAVELEDVVSNPLSIMPAGQVNQLASRQQFLDLIRYLIEIRDGGAIRARALQPSPTLLTLKLPDYEQHIDHAGLIRDWNNESFQRGEAIYRRVCQNCHGTREQPGSLPTSLRFADGKFKNGSDPLAMYQTLTRGFGLMAAQTWMVPSQKYDVIHYIRETYLRPHNPAQLAAIDDAYLARLPVGNTRGPEPSKIEPWSAMDYGPNLTHTYEIPGDEPNFAYKGVAVRLDPGAGGVARGQHWMIFDTDTLRVAAAWSAAKKGENFIDWRGIQFNGEHQIHPHVVGDVAFSNGVGPGWANPQTASFEDDQRVVGRDGRKYGPLPRKWGRYRGLYQHGQQVVLSYSVGETDLLESPRWVLADAADDRGYFVRVFNVGPRAQELVLRVADETGGRALGVVPAGVPGALEQGDDRTLLRIPPGAEPLQFAVWVSGDAPAATEQTSARPPRIPRDELDLAALTQGGPPRWPQRLTTTAVIGADDGPFASDTLTAPDANPWLAQLRFTGLDFFADGRIAACTWDGDVWVIDPAWRKLPASALSTLAGDSKPTLAASATEDGTTLSWQRIATGLFQPLGLKVLDDKIHVTCRDQLAVLHDRNADGEIDFYECLNNDHQVTEHFHEFAMGLQTDAEGNFYYAKSARHALKAVVPHHGTLLRIPRDGSRTDILANGFRAANGVCLNPDGSFVVTDQEGHWNPKNRINWVTLSPDGQPKFYGNMFGYHDVTDSADSAMEPPLCWITNAFDRSPGELLWVDSPLWGPLQGSLLNLSYGTGKVFLVPHEQVGGLWQGGMIELPIPAFPTGVMRGRFHPQDGQLYLCGMFAWAGSAQQPGGLYRLRATGRRPHLPIELHATADGLQLVFSDPLDPTAISPEQVQIQTWALKRTANYGSKHHDERSVPVRDVRVSPDGRTLTIAADLQPCWCMEVSYELQSITGGPVIGTIHNTIHRMSE